MPARQFLPCPPTPALSTHHDIHPRPIHGIPHAKDLRGALHAGLSPLPIQVGSSGVGPQVAARRPIRVHLCIAEHGAGLVWQACEPMSLLFIALQQGHLTIPGCHLAFPSNSSSHIGHDVEDGGLEQGTGDRVVPVGQSPQQPCSRQFMQMAGGVDTKRTGWHVLQMTLLDAWVTRNE